ncbi:MAG: universal stress protein UspA [Spirochaetes bacterium RBG_16_67_19]|nr:MAG: universal stress protein UspA [Spirochaetes bacterium RBG_16_67_19]
MEGPIRRILLYMDGSEGSITAAQYAICLSRYYRAELTALYVVNTRALGDLLKARIFVKAEQEEYLRDLEEDSQRYLNHVRSLARKKGLVVQTASASGTVHQEIKNCVLANKIDLLVMGELSSVRSRRDELYDEADRALRTVPCSVLVVKDEERVAALYDALV